MQLFFHFLRTRTFGKQMRRITDRTESADFDGCTTKMTHCASADRVIGQRCGARRTFGNPTAHTASDYPAVAATVEKQNGLLTALQIFLQRFIQCLTDCVCPPCPGFSANIGNRHLWQCSALIALTQCEHGISPLLCTVIAFDGWGGRTQYEDSIFLLYTAFCHITGVVAWRLFGFVRTVLLFV